MDKSKKDKIIAKFRTHDGDTGSSQVQIAILTEEIKELQGHLKIHKKDNSSRRGLLRKVNQRRKLLNYLMREDTEKYEELIKALKLKRRVTQLNDVKKKLAEEEALEAMAREEAEAEESGVVDSK